MYPVVNSEWLNQNLNDPSLVILDASPLSNKSNLIIAHPGIQIVGARFFDLKNKFSDQNSDMPNTLPDPKSFEKESQSLGINIDSTIVVYDNLGIYSSPRIWWMYKAMGHQKVAVLDGGLNAWVEQGCKTEATKKMDYPKGNFLARYDDSLKKEMPDILHNISNPSFKVIDARSSGRFCGTSPEPRAGLPSGHIPETLNLPYTTVLDKGKFKSIDELKKIFKALDLGDGRLVFTCGSGLTACIIMLASELISTNPKSVYDGSWTEWAQKQTDLIV